MVIDSKSFYASVESVDRGLNPLTVFTSRDEPTRKYKRWPGVGRFTARKERIGREKCDAST